METIKIDMKFHDLCLFTVLRNNLVVKNRGYKSPGRSDKFRFNADVVISGSQNMMNDWTLKAVFSKRILALQVCIY